jgi:hypothetical protein
VKRLVPAFLSLPLLLSFVVGCADESASGPGLTFDACEPLVIDTGSSSLSAEQTQGIADALAMWNQAAGTLLTTTLPNEATTEPTSNPTSASPPVVPLVFQVAAPPFHGLYDDQSGKIFINQDLTDVDPLHITIAHEIGHVFGLPHVSRDVRASLMNSGNMTVGITPEDVAALAALWGRCSPP